MKGYSVMHISNELYRVLNLFSDRELQAESHNANRSFITKSKPNCENSLPRLFNPYVEKVQKLDYFDPTLKKTTLYDLKHNDANILLLKLGGNDKKTSQMQRRLSQKIQDVSSLVNVSTKRDHRGNSYNSVSSHVRVGNIGIEAKYHQSIKLLREKQFEVEDLFKDKLNEIQNLKEKIHSLKLDLDLMRTLEKSNTEESDLSQVEDIRQNKHLRTQIKEKLIQDKIQELRQIRDKEKKAREEQMLMKNSQIESFKSKLEESKVCLDDYNMRRDYYKSKVDEIKSELVVYYHKLLSEGKDTRKEGLVWIIREIWNLNARVQVSYFPRFLDDKAIKYLFKVSYLTT